MLKAVSLPSETPRSEARGTASDCEATLWEWGLRVETYPEEEMSTATSGETTYLRKVCASDDPQTGLSSLTVVPDVLSEEEVGFMYQYDMEGNVEYWASFGLYDGSRLAKLEPEYVKGNEYIITKAVESQTPLRHTHGA